MSSRTAPARQRRIQKQVAKADKKRPKQEAKSVMQAGGRKYPVPPFPKQHQRKLGSEAALDPAPLYDAPFCIGSRKLEGKVALVTGGDSGIGRAVAILFAREGADIAIAYLSERGDAKLTKQEVSGNVLQTRYLAPRVVLPQDDGANIPELSVR